MCGIAGVYAFNNEGKKKINFIEQSINALHQRGPDAYGIYKDEELALAHARLAIIDTSSAANQPFVHESGNFTIVFNGEIFNYKQLREESISLSLFRDTSAYFKFVPSFDKAYMTISLSFFKVSSA